MRKRIGIVMSRVGAALGINERYYEWVNQFGDVILINPLLPINQTSPIDLLVLPGGGDIYPENYGKVPSLLTGRPNVILEYFDRNFLGEWIESGVPIFGICRGMQTLVCFFGGTLIQHIDQVTSGEERDKLVDELIILDTIKFNTSLRIKGAGYASELSRRNKFYYKVNSLHHQGIKRDNIKKPIIPLAVNKLYDNIEAIKIESRPIAGVQWHPEEINDVYSAAIVEYLLGQNR